MDSPTIRRSPRINAVRATSNNYLGDLLGYTMTELEAWIVSSSVRPHLRIWYHLCILNASRFNDAVNWLHEGENVYFHDKSGLQEDLLLECLGERNDPDSAYARPTVKGWSTLDLWARTAWRIVRSNHGEGQPFRVKYDDHPSWCYAFTIDLLCMAFESIISRGRMSPYHDLIDGEWVIVEELQSSAGVEKKNVEKARKTVTENGYESDDDASTTTDDHSSDDDYSGR